MAMKLLFEKVIMVITIMLISIMELYQDNKQLLILLLPVVFTIIKTKPIILKMMILTVTYERMSKMVY
jgi:hypothetical protein